jgi:diacylglycerol kinase family enzyme
VKIALIANPYCGKTNGRKLIPDVEKRLGANQIEFDLYLTRYHGHATEIIKQISIWEYDAVVSMGGDGTNYHVLNGVLKYHGDGDLPPLGIIPAGRGNSFGKDLQLFTVADGVAALSQQATKKVDVCRFTQRNKQYFFVNLMGLGFVTDVARTAARFKWAGDFSYVIGVFYHTLGLTYHHMELEIDGEVTAGTGLISTFPKIFKGAHGENPAVQFVRGKSATVRTRPEKTLLPDGEIFGTTPTRIDVLPGRVRYFNL